MDNFREKYSDLFYFNEEMRAIIEPALNKHPEPKTPRQIFLLYALAKSHKTQAAILLLSERGFGQDAGILARSIFELAITVLYIAKDENGKLVERFFDYDWIMRANMYDSVSEDTFFKNRIENRDPAGEEVEAVLAEAGKIKKKYPGIKHFRWSDENFREMAEKVGRLDTYKSAYHLQCNLAHPNSRNMNDYFSESEGRLEVNAGPNDEWIKSSLIATFDFFIHVVYAWDEEFEFGLKLRLDDLVKRYSVKVGKIH